MRCFYWHSHCRGRKFETCTSHQEFVLYQRLTLIQCRPFLFGTGKVRETVLDQCGRCRTTRGTLRWRCDSDGRPLRRGQGAARWREIDLEAALWAIPAQRMKAGKEHRVPLSGEALALLRAVRVKGTSSFQVASVALSCRT